MVDLYRVRTVFTGIAGTPYLSTMYFRTIDGTAQQAVNAVGAFWGAVDGQMHTDLLWDTDSDVEVISDATGQIVSVQSTTPVSGGGALSGDILPPATQALIRWRTGSFVGGREIRGKTFIPGLTETAATSGQVTTATLTAFETAAATLQGTANANLVVYSRANNTHAEVVSSSCWAQFAVLRSRRD